LIPDGPMHLMNETLSRYIHMKVHFHCMHLKEKCTEQKCIIQANSLEQNT